jgi:hypothetical protein
MTKKTWAALIGFFLVVSIGSAVFIFMELGNKSTKEVTLQQVIKEESETENIPEVATSTPTQKENIKVLDKVELPKKASVKKEGELRNIGFTYHNTKAKEVYAIGDFNNWERKPFKKQEKNWSFSVKVMPGSYNYQFIVDGKKIPDPNNKQISKEGKSVLVVKPLGSK